MPVPSESPFHDEKKAFEHLERIIWADAVVCPHCGATGGRVYALEGRSTRVGLKKCGECRKQFTVKAGTVFENARIPLHKMLHAIRLLSSGDGRVSIQDLHRTLGISYKSASSLARRIRAAIDSGALAGIIDADRARGSEDGPIIGKGEEQPHAAARFRNGEEVKEREAARHRNGSQAASSTQDSSRGTDPQRVPEPH